MHSPPPDGTPDSVPGIQAANREAVHVTPRRSYRTTRAADLSLFVVLEQVCRRWSAQSCSDLVGVDVMGDGAVTHSRRDVGVASKPLDDGHRHALFD